MKNRIFPCLQLAQYDYQKAQTYLPLIRAKAVEYGLPDLMLAYKVAEQWYNEMAELAASETVPANDRLRWRYGYLKKEFSVYKNAFAKELAERQPEVEEEFKHLNPNLLEISRKKLKAQSCSQEYLDTLNAVAKMFAEERDYPLYTEILNGK